MWSLGAILAELLTGYVLFQNDSVLWLGLGLGVGLGFGLGLG